MPTREYNQYAVEGILDRIRGGGFLLYVCIVLQRFQKGHFFKDNCI